MEPLLALLIGGGIVAAPIGGYALGRWSDRRTRRLLDQARRRQLQENQEEEERDNRISERVQEALDQVTRELEATWLPAVERHEQQVKALSDRQMSEKQAWGAMQRRVDDIEASLRDLNRRIGVVEEMGSRIAEENGRLVAQLQALGERVAAMDQFLQGVFRPAATSATTAAVSAAVAPQPAAAPAPAAVALQQMAARAQALRQEAEAPFRTLGQRGL